MERWGRSILRRLGLLAVLLLVVLFLAFLLPRLGAAPPVVMLGGATAPPAAQAQLRAEYALDQPVPVQFIRFVVRMASGDWGRSWLTGAAVGADLLARTPATLELMLYAIMLGSLLGVPLGVTAALNHSRPEDRTLRGVALLFEAMPAFVLALLLLVLLFSWLGVAPAPSGRLSIMLSPPPHVTGSYFIDAILMQDGAGARSALSQLALPVVCLALLVAAALVVQVRQAILVQRDTGHFAHARAQGMSRDMLGSIALRGAAPAIATAIGGQLVALFAATAVVEYVFSWGGIGQLGLDSIARADFAVVQGFILYGALFTMVVQVLTHLATLGFRVRVRRA